MLGGLINEFVISRFQAYRIESKKQRLLTHDVLVQIRRYETAAEAYRLAAVEADRQRRERAEAKRRKTIARQQAQQEAARKRREYWESLSGVEFENELAVMLRKLGYNVQLTPTTEDQGVDLIAKRQNKTTIIQCKRYKNPVGPAVIRELYGTVIAHHADQGLLACTGGFTKGVYQFAEGKPLLLWDMNELVKWGQETENRGKRK